MSTTLHDTSILHDASTSPRRGGTTGARTARLDGSEHGISRRFLSGTLLLITSSLGCQLLAMAAVPVLTQLYSPADFGTLGVFLALFAPLSAIVGFKYENAIPLPRDDRDAIRLMIASAVIILVFTGVVSLLVFLLGGVVARTFRTPLLTNYLWILPWAVLFSGCHTTISFWNLRKRQFGSVASSRAAETVGRVVTECSLGLTSWQPFGLLAAQCLSKAYAASVLTLQLPWQMLREQGFQWPAVWASAKSYRQFPLLAVPSTIVESIAASIPCLLLPILFGPVEAGLFLMAQRLLSWPISLFGHTISQVYYSELSCCDVSAAEKRRLFYRLSVLMATGSAMIGILFLTAPLWCGWILGDRWSSVGTIIAVLTPMLFGHLVVCPFNQVPYAYAKQNLLLHLNLARLILSVLVFTVGWAASLSATSCIFAFSVTVFAISVIQWAMVKSLLRNDLPSQANRVLPETCLSNSDCGAPI